MFDGILLRSTRCGPCFRFDSIDTSQFAGNASVPLIEAPFMPEVFRVLEILKTCMIARQSLTPISRCVVPEQYSSITSSDVVSNFEDCRSAFVLAIRLGFGLASFLPLCVYRFRPIL